MVGGDGGVQIWGRYMNGGSPAVLCGYRAGTGSLGSLGASFDAVGVYKLAGRR